MTLVVSYLSLHRSQVIVPFSSFFGADLSYFYGSTSVHKTGTPTLCVLMTERREAGLLEGERRKADLLVDGRRDAGLLVGERREAGLLVGERREAGLLVGGRRVA